MRNKLLRQYREYTSMMNTFWSSWVWSRRVPQTHNSIFNRFIMLLCECISLLEPMSTVFFFLLNNFKKWLTVPLIVLGLLDTCYKKVFFPGSWILGEWQQSRSNISLPDGDWRPSVVIDVLIYSCMQNMTATTTEFSDRVSILKENMKELIPKVLLLSCKGKKITISK